MHYDLSLTIQYFYDQASDNARNFLHLLPRSIPDQQEVFHSLLTVTPEPQERWDTQDFFGNTATWISYLDAIEGFEISLKTHVARQTMGPGMDFSPPLKDLRREIDAVRSIGPDAPYHFLGASPRVPLDPHITAFANAQIGPEMSACSVVVTLGQALHQYLEFDDTATEVDTAPTDAFANRRGVCQDFSHIMIAALRGIGIPAGYVSGFLRTVAPPGQQKLEGADAMHAWVRAWCGSEMGWIEYDPTNAIAAADDHIVVAYGRDYSDVSPVRGVVRSSGGHATKHFVDVIPVE